MERIKRTGVGGGGRGGILIVKMDSEEEKRKILQNKWRLKGEEVWIEKDLTWQERNIRWKLR